MKALVGIPTLSRSDLLVRNKAFLESVCFPDDVLIVDNGSQVINLQVPIKRVPRNLGVSGSWNYFLRKAFVDGRFDALVLLNDDIIWSNEKLETAKRLVYERPDVDLFLGNLQFSVQVHRPSNLSTIGFYDEQFYPGYCEDDDYAIRMVKAGRIWERFESLDPLPGSISEGTRKFVPWTDQHRKLVAKWGKESFGINIPHAPYYRTNKGVKF